MAALSPSESNSEIVTLFGFLIDLSKALCGLLQKQCCYISCQFLRRCSEFCPNAPGPVNVGVGHHLGLGRPNSRRVKCDGLAGTAPRRFVYKYESQHLAGQPRLETSKHGRNSTRASYRLRNEGKRQELEARFERIGPAEFTIEIVGSPAVEGPAAMEEMWRDYGGKCSDKAVEVIVDGTEDAAYIANHLQAGIGENCRQMPTTTTQAR